LFSLLDIIRPKSPIRILDLGAMYVEGHEPSYGPLVAAGVCEVLGFEPNEDECARLNSMYADSGRRRFLPYAVGDGTAKEFRVCRMRSRSSLYEPNSRLCEKFNAFQEGSEVVERRAVQTVRLDDLPEVDDVDYIKMDVQGAECDVIAGGGRAAAAAAVAEIEVEFVEQYLGQPLFSDLDLQIRHHGYMFHTFLGYGTRALKPIVVDGDPLAGLRQWLWADAVYLKHIDSFDRLPPEKLIKLAIIMHEVYGSYDFAHHALAHHDDKCGGDLSRRYISAF